MPYAKRFDKTFNHRLKDERFTHGTSFDNECNDIPVSAAAWLISRSNVTSCKSSSCRDRRSKRKRWAASAARRPIPLLNARKARWSWGSSSTKVKLRTMRPHSRQAIASAFCRIRAASASMTIQLQAHRSVKSGQCRRRLLSGPLLRPEAKWHWCQRKCASPIPLLANAFHAVWTPGRIMAISLRAEIKGCP